MTGRSLCRIPLAIVLGSATPAVAQEHVTYTISPLVGFYLPTTDLASEQNILEPSTGQPATVTFGQEASLAWGLRAGRTLTSRLAVEAEFLYSSSAIELSAVRTGIGLSTLEFDAHVIAVGADVLLEIFRTPFTPFSIHALGGLALVNRGGDFFDVGQSGIRRAVFGGLDGGTDVALVLGTTFKYGLSPRLGARFDVRDYISSYKQSLPGPDLGSELQNDVWITAGVELTF